MVLGLFFLGAATAYKEAMTGLTHVIFVLVSVLLTFATPFLVLIDEANSSHVVPLEKIHYIITVAYITLSILWIFISMEASNKLSSKMTRSQQQWYSFLKKYILFGMIMLAFNVFEWTYAYSDRTNWWINENVEALCEWTVVGMAVFLPFFYSLTYNRFEFRFTIN